MLDIKGAWHAYALFTHLLWPSSITRGKDATEPELEGKTLATAPTYSSRLPAGQNASLPHWMRTVNH